MEPRGPSVRHREGQTVRVALVFNRVTTDAGGNIAEIQSTIGEASRRKADLVLFLGGAIGALRSCLVTARRRLLRLSGGRGCWRSF